MSVCVGQLFHLRNKTWAIKGLAEDFCCPLNQRFPMLTCTRIIGEPVKTQILIQQIQGRTQDSAFLASCRGKPEPTWGARLSLLLSSQDYVTVFTGLPRPPPDGSMSIFPGSCCWTCSLGSRTRGLGIFWFTNAWPFKWAHIQLSEAFLTDPPVGRQLPSALCWCRHL